MLKANTTESSLFTESQDHGLYLGGFLTLKQVIDCLFILVLLFGISQVSETVQVPNKLPDPSFLFCKQV